MDIIKTLRNGGIGVIPTDTIYGLVGSALNKRAVERIYRVRKRDPKKPFIILISSLSELKKFGVKLESRHEKILKNLWFTAPVPRKIQGSKAEGSGPVSVIMPCNPKKFRYLHRGTNTLAFRVPKDKKLRVFLKRTGPLVAPSANISGRPPAKTIKEAKKYFGDRVDFYVDGGLIKGSPSVILELKR